MSIEKTEIDNINETNKPDEKCLVIISNLDEFDNIKTRSYRGDLRTIGVKFCPGTTVYAAPPPKKEYPKELPASELPIYGCDHLKKKESDDTPQCDEKLLHNAVKPKVVAMRQGIQNSINSVTKELTDTYNEISTDVGNAANKVKTYCRDDKNLRIRQGIVATGGLLGYYLASKGGIPRRIFFTACGLAATGLLCFPKETDEKIRDVSYYVGKGVVEVINFMGGRNLEIRENLPCPKPKPPDEKLTLKCEEKKK